MQQVGGRKLKTRRYKGGVEDGVEEVPIEEALAKEEVPVMPSSMAPSTVMPSLAVPSSATPSPVMPSLAVPSSVVPSTVMPSVPSSVVPSPVMPSLAVPSSVAPSSVEIKQPLPTAVEIVDQLKTMPKGTIPFQGPALALAGALAPMVDKYKDRIARMAGYENADDAVTSMVQLAMRQALPPGINVNTLSQAQLDKYRPAIETKLNELEGQFTSSNGQGEVCQPEYVATDPTTGIKTILSGGYKIKQKGGLLGFGPSAEQTIESYKKTIEIITQINSGGNPSVMSNGVFRPYNDLVAKEKTQQLQQFTKTILAFMQVLNKNPDLVKAKMTPSSGGKKSKKQRGGADEMIFSKMYNTQGLIEDTNDPIQNALAYNNTADQIPQPFSSGSSGAASYTSGIDATFLQDVLPVLGMAGGKKKSKSKSSRK